MIFSIGDLVVPKNDVGLNRYISSKTIFRISKPSTSSVYEDCSFYLEVAYSRDSKYKDDKGWGRVDGFILASNVKTVKNLRGDNNV